MTAAPAAASAGAFPYGPPAEASARFCPWCYRGDDSPCAVQAHWPEVRAHRPLYLSGVECHATRSMEAAGADVGLMLQPASGLASRAPHYRWWAADNGCFAQGEEFDRWAWFEWLRSLPDVGRRRRCLFAVAPDVLGDADATWERTWPWLPLVRGLGIPVAVVAQNGADAHAPLWECDELWDVLFLGGAPECRRCAWIRTDPLDQRRRCPLCGGGLAEWKLSGAAAACAREAHRSGKWVHMGRVNSWRRLELAASWDLDSVDGTYLAFAPDANGRRLARWLSRLSAERPLL